MLKRFLLLLLLVTNIAFASSSDNYKNCIIKEDKIDGCYAKVYSPNGDLLFEGVYKNSYKQGLHKLYFHNRLRSVDNYNNGALHGISKQYDQAGKLVVVKNYKDGLLHGFYKGYDSTGKITSIANYQEGQLHGSYYTYYHNGNLEREYTYQNDFLRNLKVYGINGSLIFPLKKCEKNEDFMTGCSLYKYDYGRILKYIITYKNGQRNGISVRFNGRGDILYEYYYKNNEVVRDPIFYSRQNNEESYSLTGKSMYTKECSTSQDIIDGCVSYDYYENHMLKSVVNLKNGELNGKASLYTKDGNLSRSVTLENGLLDGAFIRYYSDTSNRILEDINFEEGLKQGSYKVYYRSGALRIKGSFYNDLLHGIDKEYYENGGLKMLCTYRGGWKNGHQISYFENGQIKEELYYENGLRDGPFKTYYPNGQLKVEGTYDHDYIKGEILEFYENGNLRFKKFLNKGILEGELLSYHNDGTLSERTNFISGKMDGDKIFYNKDGSTYLVLKYKNGILISGKCSNGHVFNDAQIHSYEKRIRPPLCSDDKKTREIAP